MTIIINKQAASLALLSFVVFLHPLHVCTVDTNQTSPRPPAIIVFGDSVVDPGNNNAILTMVRCNYPPYGKDFVGHRATGRFSNGKIPSDLIASQLGIKEYVPAYLGSELSAYDLITGVSFASGGCGFDPLTSQLVSAISMDGQLNLFKEYKEKVKAIVGEKRAAYIIKNSIYFIVTGTDDLANTYFPTPFRRFEYDLPSYINFTVQSASTFIQKLYHLGGRRISVANIPPIGCLPSQRTLAGGIERICDPTYNQAAMSFNSKLSNEAQRLNGTLPKSRIRYIDMYTPLLDMILHPSKYGFVESKRGCCGTGTFEVTQTCNSLTTFVCEDASKYVFWDSYHPTERGYKILMGQLTQRYGASIN
ncbi:GDSL esterase/lipase EXL3-like [Phalaenopsis equestris]|uniref:GDSL esterase/lipase EXL3-like n=1 Tax=Phalaenopsis equestris TaxID=78828 RepID=UPI0009E196E3|nr:GDSL esterase/lipase EXL3-like [Phalaenopsis equestris]